MRDRLVELLKQSSNKVGEYIMENDKIDYTVTTDEICGIRADYLLANGVIVPPVKLGDKVYRVSTKHITHMKYIEETTISRIAIDGDGIWFFCKCNPTAKCVFGKTVFLTKEEAEQALRKDEGE